MKQIFILLLWVFCLWILCIADSSDGVVLYFTGNSNDVSGATMFGKSGFGNNGTLTNTVIAPCLIREGFVMNGTNSWVNAGASKTLDIVGSNPMTVSAWVMSTNNAVATFQGIVSKANIAGDEKGWILSKGINNKFYFMVRVGSTNPRDEVSTYSNSAYTDNAWHHVVGVLLSTGAHTIYVDGVLQTASFAGGAGWLSAAINIPCLVGACYGDTPSYEAYGTRFGGYVDEVYIFNRALSASEILSLYNKNNRSYVNNP